MGARIEGLVGRLVQGWRYADMGGCMDGGTGACVGASVEGWLYG